MNPDQHTVNLDEFSMYVVVFDEWGYHRAKRTAAARQAIQQKWNERLKRRLQKEVGELGSSSAPRKM